MNRPAHPGDAKTAFGDRLSEALRQSEERCLLVLEATSDGIWEWDLRTNRVHYNPAYTRMLGYEPEEFSGNLSEWLERIHPDDRERALAANQRCIENDVAQFAVEFRMRTKAGTWKWILGRGMAVERDASGKALRMIGAHTDITRIKEAERRETIQNWIAATLSSMTHLDERLALVFDAILKATGMECGGIYLLDPEKNVLRLVHHQGLSDDFVKAVRSYPADSPNLKLVLRGTPLYTAYDDLPVPKKEPENREGLRAIAVVPIHYEGRVVGCINTASRSFTETPEDIRSFLEAVGSHLGNALGRIQARQDLEESTKQYAALFQLAGDALFVVRVRDRRILDVNRSASGLLGYAEGELLGAVWDAVIDASEGDNFVDRCLARLDARDVCLVEGYLRTRGGTTVPVEISAKPFEMKGELLLFMMARDISERLRAQEEKERLQEQLRQAQKMESIGRLAGGIAHDFNNLLTPILGYADMLSRFLEEGSPARHQTEAICKAALKAKDLVEQLLAFSRDQAAAFENVDLAETVRGFYELFRPSLPSHVELRLTLPKTPVWVKADPKHLERVLLNLTVNARDAMPEGGSLSVLLEQRTFHHESDMPAVGLKPGTYAVLTVADTGMGMDGETAQKIFEPFFTTKPFGKGAGLGLSIVYGIVENHGGKILASSLPGVGTAFEIYLPVSLPPAA
ncbi:MAG: PAS domain S-box protein [Desulfosoma sp.]